MLSNKKIYVGKHSKEIQEKAFELGWRYKDRKDEINNKIHLFWYFTKEKEIICESDSFDFTESIYQEITFEELMEMQPKKEEYQFKPFEKVLVKSKVRDAREIWVADFYSHYEETHVMKHICVGFSYAECIPYEGNEHLLGTTDNP